MSTDRSRSVNLFGANGHNTIMQSLFLGLLVIVPGLHGRDPFGQPPPDSDVTGLHLGDVPQLFYAAADDVISLPGCDNKDVYLDCFKIIINMNDIKDEGVLQLALPDGSVLNRSAAHDDGKMHRPRFNLTFSLIIVLPKQARRQRPDTAAYTFPTQTTQPALTSPGPWIPTTPLADLLVISTQQTERTSRWQNLPQET
jgi:hypothetical protein